MKNKGFTLMEMLIVVAIIAILVVIAIPTLTGSFESSREAADLANLRAAYATVISDGMIKSERQPGDSDTIKYNYNFGSEYSARVKAQQLDPSGWVTGKSGATFMIGNNNEVPAAASPDGWWTVTYDVSTGKTKIEKTS